MISSDRRPGTATYPYPVTVTIAGQQHRLSVGDSFSLRSGTVHTVKHVALMHETVRATTYAITTDQGTVFHCTAVR